MDKQIFITTTVIALLAIGLVVAIIVDTQQEASALKRFSGHVTSHFLRVKPVEGLRP